MLGFMGQHYRDWPEVQGLDRPALVSRPTEDIRPDRMSIGVVLQDALPWEREYAASIVRWIALKIGSKRTHFTYGTVIPPTPFVLLNEAEAVPVIVLLDEAVPCVPPSALHLFTVNHLGVRCHPGAQEDWFKFSNYEDDHARRAGSSGSATSAEIKTAARHAHEALTQEMGRLDRLWPGVSGTRDRSR